jgi:alkaline phosphatase D
MTLKQNRRAVVAGLGASSLGGIAHTAIQSVPQLTSADLLTRFAFGSCNNQRKTQSHWAAIRAQKPQLMVMMGDNVYGDLDAQGPSHLAAAYAELLQSPQFRDFTAAIPIEAIWDDHDYGANDGDASYEHAADAKKQFLEFWNVPQGDVRRRRPGLHHAKIFGPVGQRVQLIFLDLRSFRGPLVSGYNLHRNMPGLVVDQDPNLTLLGQDQWQWLGEQLRAPAEVRILISSIQVIGDGGENWKLFAIERKRLFDLIRETRAQGLFVLSGDVHTGAMYRFNRNVPYPIYEFTSSGLNQGPQSGVMDEAYLIEGGVYADSNFGLLNVDWQANAIKITLHASDGRVVRSRTIALSELGVTR